MREDILNEIWILDLSPALVGMLMSPSKLFLFSNEAQLNSSARLYWNCTVLKSSSMLIVLFTTCAKLTLGFTLTPLFPDVVVISDSSKNVGGSTDSCMAKKRHRLAGFSYPYSPPLELYKVKELF